MGKMAVVGFEPTPPWRLVPKTSALDHSATLPQLVCQEIPRISHTIGKEKKGNGDAGSRTPDLSHAKRTLYH